MVADLINKVQHAGRCRQNILYQLPVCLVVGFQVALVDIHQLDDKVDPEAGRVCVFLAHDVLFAQDRDLVFYDEIGCSVPVCQNSPAYNHPFLWF